MCWIEIELHQDIYHSKELKDHKKTALLYQSLSKALEPSPGLTRSGLSDLCGTRKLRGIYGGLSCGRIR